jgi:GNAT superfamily N-acetyltransferase
MQSTYKTRPARAADLAHLPGVERSAGTLFRTVEGLETLADDDPMPIEKLQEILEVGNVWVAVHVEKENETHRGRSTAETETDPDHDVDTRLQIKHDAATSKTNEQAEIEAEGEERIVGFLAAFPLIGPQIQSPDLPPSQFLHVAELSIHASHQRRRLARRLLDDLICHAEQVNRTSSSPSLSPRQARINALTLTTYHTVSFNGPFYAKMGFNAIPVDEISARFGTEARQIWDEEQVSIAMPEGRAWMVFWMDRRVERGGKG